MAAQSQGSHGNDPYKTASKVVVEWLVQQVGCEADDFKVLDGSGLSRHNLLTTRGLTRLLNYCKHQSFAASWAQALAVPGYGTLKGRLAGSAFWGKTGTLDSVAALSGYLRDLENNQLSLSILVNNFVAKPNDVRNATDGFVRKLEISLGGRCIPAKSAVLQVRS